MAYTTIDDPEAYFQIKQYTGNDTDGHAITFDGTTDMQPDLVWIKAFAADYVHQLVDSVRGVNKPVRSNADSGEQSLSDSFDSFDSDGFTLGADAATDNFNHSQNYISWNWKESDTAGFDIVSYTGNGSTRTISHSLSAVPNFVVIKCRSDDRSWVVTNTNKGFTGRAFLDTADDWEANSGEFNDTAPTSSVFTLGGDYRTNKSSETYIAYLWRNVKGFCHTGVYVGNGNASGPYVHCGFRPAFILGTNTTNDSNHWWIVDANRSPYNGDSKWFKADDTAAQLTNLVNPDFTANGFKIRSSDAIYNTDGSTFMYIAFAEAPFVNSNGVPCNAR